MVRHLMFFLLMGVIVGDLSAQTEPPGSWPAFLTASRLENRFGKAPEPTLVTPTSEAARRHIADAIGSLPRFPDYLNSGCHDRAHAAFLLLPDSLRWYSMKIWVFAPERFTAGVTGVITLRDNSVRTTEAEARWGYHVALAFKDSAGKLSVHDPALAPGRLISREEWFALMNIPSMSFWTLVPGWVYNFHSTSGLDLADHGSRNGNLFNGGMFDYSGKSRDERWIPRALARDAVGEAVSRGNACSTLAGLRTNPGEMQKRLEENTLPADCSAQIELFERELDRWTKMIGWWGLAN
ncbi:MAG TPA: protein-glutamine glutaminase family protein [Longimicrobium sp.]|nr:protein-glutamine glutaminase family protein [Longimicrobium sp.]